MLWRWDQMFGRPSLDIRSSSSCFPMKRHLHLPGNPHWENNLSVWPRAVWGWNKIQERAEPPGYILCYPFRQVTWISSWRKAIKSHQVRVSPSVDAQEESRELVSLPLSSWASWRRQNYLNRIFRLRGSHRITRSATLMPQTQMSFPSKNTPLKMIFFFFPLAILF